MSSLSTLSSETRTPPPGSTGFPDGVLLPYLLAGVVLLISILITHTIWERETEKVRHELRNDFEVGVREVAQRIEQRMATYEQVLRGAQGLFVASEAVSQDDFQRYVNSLQLQTRYPGIQGIGVVRILSPNAIDSHVAGVRAAGFPDYQVHPAPDGRPLITAITQIEPVNPENLRAHGFDMWSESTRRTAMAEARDTGDAALTGRLALEQDADDTALPGFIMLLPLYQRDLPPQTIPQRRAAIWGWLEAPFRMSDLMDGLGGERAHDLNLQIFDVANNGTTTLLHQSHPEAEETALFSAARPMEVANHTWKLQASSLPAFEERLNNGTPRFVAITGLGISLLLGFLIWLLASGRARALALAMTMTNEVRESKEWLNLALDSASLGVIDWDLQHDSATRSLRHDQIYGQDSLLPDWNWEVFASYLLPNERSALLQRLRQSLQEGRVAMDFCILRADDRRCWVSLKGTAMHDASDKPVRLVGMVADITAFKHAADALRHAHDELETRVMKRTVDLQTANQELSIEIAERKKIESQLFSSREQLASIFDAVTEGLIVQQADGRFMELNNAAERILGFSAQELAQARHLDEKLETVHEDGSPFPGALHPWSVALRTGRPIRKVIMGLKKPHDILTWISINTELLFDEGDQVSLAVSSFSDITEKKRSEEVIWQQANFDTLTGLPNRRLFHEHLEQAIRVAHRSGLPLALMFIDLDHFKDVNDSLGHDAGDLLLKQATARITDCVRETDMVARLGGDEFTVILGQLQNQKHVALVGQKILDALAEPFEINGEAAYVSASIGITLYPEDATDIENLLKNADQAMYAAKGLGRNRSKHFTESMQEATQARMWLATELRQALAKQQFSVVYQPIVELATGKVAKAEALIRWQHPVRGAISPALFIPVAEETGLIVEIGDWVFREVADQLKAWRSDLHPNFQVSINRSPVQFRSGNEPQDSWAQYLQSLGLPGHSIALEITEGLLLDASSSVTDQLLEFRDAGIQVSLDDFGTGYSSLAYLKKFDIDHLKIDQSFVRNLAPGSDDMALCEAIIMMAHKLQIKVIAEGVETVQQRDLLAAAGCDYGQGYLFSKPVPADQLLV